MGPKGIAQALRVIARYPGALTMFAVCIRNTSEMVRHLVERAKEDPATDDDQQANTIRFIFEESMIDLGNAVAIRVMEGYRIPANAIDVWKLATAIVNREWGDWSGTDPIVLAPSRE